MEKSNEEDNLPWLFSMCQATVRGTGAGPMKMSLGNYKVLIPSSLRFSASIPLTATFPSPEEKFPPGTY